MEPPIERDPARPAGPDDPLAETGPLLTADDIIEFRTLVREETGADLSDEEAWSRAHELVALVRMLVGPLPEDREP